MAISIRASNGHYLNHHTFRFARTQREAGLEWFAWEGRLRPLSRDIAIGGVITAAAIVLGFTLL